MPTQPPPFRISLAEWSLNRSLFGGQIDHLDFPRIAKADFGIDAVEYVNQFFMDKAEDRVYLAEMKRRCDDLGVRSLLIMCDKEGNLGAADAAERQQAVENHYKWAEAARFIGCHSVRVNAYAEGTADEQSDRAADGLRRLCEFAGPLGLNVLVENHGGLSSNAAWLAGVVRKVGLANCGTLPDFGNFRVSEADEYDRYRGVAELMPLAKGVSAKTHDFDAGGNETRVDYVRLMKIVLAAGYRGYVGIEYGGKALPEMDGIRKSLELLERVRGQLAAGG